METNTFIQNLKNKLNSTRIFDEEDGSIETGDTADERMRVLKGAEPKTAEDIVAFVAYLELINVLQNQEMFDRVKRIIELASINTSTEQIQVAIDILAKYERPKSLFARLFNDHTKKFDKTYNPFEDDLPIDLL